MDSRARDISNLDGGELVYLGGICFTRRFLMSQIRSSGLGTRAKAGVGTLWEGPTG